MNGLLHGEIISRLVDGDFFRIRLGKETQWVRRDPWKRRMTFDRVVFGGECLEEALHEIAHVVEIEDPLRALVRDFGFRPPQTEAANARAAQREIRTVAIQQRLAEGVGMGSFRADFYRRGISVVFGFDPPGIQRLISIELERRTPDEVLQIWEERRTLLAERLRINRSRKT
jgi:hypothetical protein